MRYLDTSPGWIMRKFREIDRRLREMDAQKRIAHTSFPAGIIPNSALVNPTAPGYVSLSTTNFPVLVAGANLIDTTVTVPSGFTSCVINVTGRVFAYNSTATDDYLYARASINGTTATAVPLRAIPSGATANLSPLAMVLTGLTPGGTFPLQLWAKAATADWAANASNTAELTGSIVWFA